jgi:hypothetical protein
MLYGICLETTLILLVERWNEQAIEVTKLQEQQLLLQHDAIRYEGNSSVDGDLGRAKAVRLVPIDTKILGCRAAFVLL